MNAAKERALVKKIIARFGAVIDMEKDPSLIVDIIRTFRFAFDNGDGGVLPGGVGGPPPPTEPGVGGGVTLGDLMKVLLKVSRQLAVLRTAGGSAAKARRKPRR